MSESFPSENGKSIEIRTARTDESDRRPGPPAFVGDRSSVAAEPHLHCRTQGT